MKKTFLSVLIAGLLAFSCGVKKDYVDKLIADSESRTGSRISAVSTKADSTAAEVARLEKLSLDLQNQVGMSVNQASGFEDYVVVWKGEVTFGFDQAVVDEVAASVIAEGAKQLAQTKRSIIEISGHCDATGNRDYNYLLGERRANAAKRYLADKYGIALYRMFIISYGKDKPIALPDQRSGNAKNRRVELQVWAPRQAPAAK